MIIKTQGLMVQGFNKHVYGTITTWVTEESEVQVLTQFEYLY